MISLPVFILFVISAGVFYGGSWVSESAPSCLPHRRLTGFLPRRNFPPNCTRCRLSPEPRVEKPGPDLRKADEAIKTAEIHIREAEKAAEQAERVLNRNRQNQPLKKPWLIMVLRGALPLAIRPRRRSRRRNGPGWMKTTLGNKFAVEADDKVWIQVRIDDKETLSAMLRPGDRREWPADKALQVVIGNAGGIHMKWNEHHLKAPRDPGRVLRFRLPDYAKAE